MDCLTRSRSQVCLMPLNHDGLQLIHNHQAVQPSTVTKRLPFIFHSELREEIKVKAWLPERSDKELSKFRHTSPPT